MSSVFAAKYSGGKCPDCGDPFKVGDDVSYLDGALYHAECNPLSNYGDNFGFGDSVWAPDDGYDEFGDPIETIDY